MIADWGVDSVGIVAMDTTGQVSGLSSSFFHSSMTSYLIPFPFPFHFHSRACTGSSYERTFAPT
jgi:hypothetical protein